MIDVRRLDLGEPALLEAVLALQRSAYGVEAELVGTDALPPLRETAADLATSEETFLGAFDPGLVGFVSWRRDGETVDIHRLAVSPAAFRRGVARTLLGALEREVAGAQRWTVATGEANAPARALYEAAGFRQTGARTVAEGVAIVEFTRP